MSPSPARRRGLRILLPAALILVWLAAASIGGPYFGRVSEVSSNDQTSYLPSSADATAVQQRLGEFRDSNDIPAVAVFTADRPLTEADIAAAQQAIAAADSVPGVQDGASPAIPSEDGAALEAFIPISADADIGDTVSELSAALSEALPDGVTVLITGPAGFTADLVAGFAGIDGVLLLTALAAVFVILIIVYRSLLLPVAVLGTSVFALTVALLSVWWLAKAGVFVLSGQTQGILFILVIGAATDYSLLYVSRYREQLRLHEDRGAATRQAIRRSFEPILASGGTVIAGLLCLLFSDLKSNSTLGPVAAIGIVFAMLASLTLLPAVLFAFGRASFWPLRPRFDPDAAAQSTPDEGRGVWARLGRVIRARARLIWSVTAVVLIIGAVGVTQLRADGVPQSDLVLGSSQARDGQQVLGEHFPAGSGSPAYIVVSEQAMQSAADAALGVSGVDSLTVTAAEAPSGAVAIAADGLQQAPGAEPGTAEPTVSDGDVLLQATLAAAADSEQAETIVTQLRAAFDTEGIDAMVGGVTATAVDTDAASIHDRTLIIPIVLVVITLILMLLLRSILAPVLLVLTTVLSFATALGVSALMFNGVFDFPGADPAVPLFGFVFLVALGIDYNIFLATRIREEAKLHGTRDGIIRGLAETGGVITSAGLVLAATFAALSVIPILFLVQIAFIVAFGVLLDTFLVRAFLVPALMHDVGRRVWWPSSLARAKD